MVGAYRGQVSTRSGAAERQRIVIVVRVGNDRKAEIANFRHWIV